MANLTYVDAINFALDVMNPDVDPDDDKFSWDEVKEKLEALKAQLEKRKHSSNKPTKTQVANEGIKETILTVLGESDAPMRVKDLLADERLADFTSPKITALLRQLLPDTGDGRVVRTVEKKVAYFALA